MSTDITLDLNAASTLRGDGAAALQSRTWFEAPTAAGALRMCTFAGKGAAEHAVEAAIVLRRYEDLLTALEAWTALALDWRWCAAPPSRLHAASHGCARWQPQTQGEAMVNRSACEQDCLLELPWALLRSLAAPADKVDLPLHWQVVPVVLAIARFGIAIAELNQLESGGAVVLPDSLQQPWHGYLRGADEPAHVGQGVPVILPSPWAPRLARSCVASNGLAKASASVVERAADHGVACEVRLTSLRSLAGDRLAGWFDHEMTGVEPSAEIWRCATEGEPATWLASGQLMPWGEGWALGLETVCARNGSETKAIV